jgi:hypothetical protein
VVAFRNPCGSTKPPTKRTMEVLIAFFVFSVAASFATTVYITLPSK